MSYRFDLGDSVKISNTDREGVEIGRRWSLVSFRHFNLSPSSYYRLMVEDYVLFGERNMSVSIGPIECKVSDLDPLTSK